LSSYDRNRNRVVAKEDILRILPIEIVIDIGFVIDSSKETGHPPKADSGRKKHALPLSAATHVAVSL
jgi:hypothetical protein